MAEIHVHAPRAGELQHAQAQREDFSVALRSGVPVKFRAKL
jgi:hypothetical protein